MEVIGYYFYGINCFDLGKVKIWKDLLDVFKGFLLVNKFSLLINFDYNIDGFCVCFD